MTDPPLDAEFLPAALQASQTLDLGEFLDLCAGALGELLGPESVHGYVRVAGGPGLELRCSWTARRRTPRRPPAVLDEVHLSAGDGQGHLTDGRSLRPGAAPWTGGETEQVLLLPMLGEEPAACLFLVIGGQELPEFQEAGVARAGAFLRAVAPAMRNIRLVSDLRETAVRDDLAGCYNRRHFESFLAEEIARARRFRTRVSILFLDMDNLKSVNTQFGHAMGSRTLQEVSDRIDGGIRKIDKLFRFGGDEFCVVLPETGTRGAQEAAERTRRSIEARPLLVAEVGGVHLTASLGIATYPDHALSGEDLVQAADRAMQAVKGAGKNAIGIAAPVTPAPMELGPANGTAGDRP